MGVKRPLEEETLPELSFEQPKQLDNNKKLAFATEDFPSHAVAPEFHSPGEAKDDFCQLDSDGVFENGGRGDAFIAVKEVEASEEDVGIKNSCVPGYIDFNMPWRLPQQFDDPYIYFLNVPPRKEILIGQDNQAEVPKWDPSGSGKDFPGSNNVVDIDWEQKWMGTCITPMPGSNDSSTDEFIVGRGRTTGCSCHDMGSMRCVQQHVREAREKLRDTLGDERFTKLGFYEMGEEIARRWSSNDQRLFHKVVNSNPISHGRDFWRHLSAVFPTRTKKELVSYYFNVFVLWRRGIQNRSYLMQIDSDHEEEPKVASVEYRPNRPLLDEGCEDGDNLQRTQGDFLVEGGDEDSEVESFISDQELDVGWVDDYESEPENVRGDEGGNVNDGTFDGIVVKKDGVDGGSNDNSGSSDGYVPKEGAVKMDGAAGQMSEQETNKYPGFITAVKM